MSDPTSHELPQPKFKLSLTGKGISVDQEVDRPTALQILAVLMGGGGQLPTPPVTGASAHVRVGGTPSQSIQEKLEAAGANRWPDKIVVIGQHLQDSGNARFSKDDVRKQIDVARLGKPGNYDRDFVWTVRIGWVAPDSTNPKQFYVTKKGVEAISQQFSAEVKKATSQPKPARRRKKKAATTAPTTTE